MKSDDVFRVLMANPLGVSRRDIQSRLGIADPAAEASRPRVWRLAAILAGLWRDRFASAAMVGGVLLYFPRGEG